MKRNIILALGWEHFEMIRYPPNYPFGAKYLLCEDEKGTKFIAVSAYAKEHVDIQPHLKDSDKILGGGQIYYYGKEKGFLLTESSVMYGKADHEQTKKILNEKYPSAPVEIK